MDEGLKEEFQIAYNRFASSGRRVLGFAYKHFRADPSTEFDAENPTYPTKDLIFLGLSAIMDPPKDGVRDAITKCHTGGIKVGLRLWSGKEEKELNKARLSVYFF